jgi:chromosome segregation ATPase
MALFHKSDPAKKRQRDLEDKLKATIADRDKIAERLREFQARATERRDAARSLVRDGGDDAKLAIVESEMRAAEDRVDTLTGGLADIDDDINELKREIAQVIDLRCREETAAAVNAVADKWASAVTAFDTAAGQLADLARESAVIVLDAQPLHVFIDAVKQQVPPEVEAISKVLRDHAKAVMAGTAPASLPEPEVATVQCGGPNSKPNPILAAADFQPLDRGPARTLKVAT